MSPRLFRLPAALFLLSLLPTPQLFAGKLDGVRSAVSGGSYRSSSSSERGGGGGSDHAHEDGDGDTYRDGHGYRRGHHRRGYGYGYGYPYFYGHALSPFFWGGGQSGDVYIPESPEVGMVPVDLANAPAPVPAFLLQGEYGVIDDNTDRVGFRGMFLYDQWLLRFGLNRVEEDLDAAGSDSLDFYDVQAGMFLAGGKQGCLWVSVGLQGLSDEFVDDAGVIFEIGGALAPEEWLLLEAALGGGSIGDANIGRARVDAGIVFGQFRGLIGYEHFEVGDVDLGGPYFGLGFRF